MSTSQRLELKQGQSLVMTPQLQQSLKLLQYSSQELAEYIEQELEKNPLLMLSEQEGDTERQSSESVQEQEDAQRSVAADNADASDATHSDFADNTSTLDINYENTWDSKENELARSPAEESGEGFFGVSRSSSNHLKDRFNFEQVTSKEITIEEYILDQINVDFDDPAEKIIAAHLVDMLDENGYIQSDFSGLAERLRCKAEDIEKVLLKLQKCDPAGAFARSLSECLALQLKDRNRYDPAMELLLDNLELLARGEIAKLQKICGVSQEDILDMCQEIKSLNPRPANEFARDMTQLMIPDVYVRKNPKGVWELELNTDVLPRVLVNNMYYAQVKEKVKNSYEKQYLSDQYQTANWLVRAVNQRAETILKVSTEIVAQQREFLEKGIYHLKPLTLKDIADVVGVHESTVGRVTNNKYMATPSGNYELKFFFSSSLHASEGDEDVSSKAVKHMIKELIENETAKAVLSDDKIAEILNEKGVDVARRTVAKYREAMHIPSSVQRRRQKKMQASG